MPKEPLWPKQPKEEEHLLHMWRPFRLRIDKKYKFLPRGPVFKTVQSLLRTLVMTVFPPYFKLCRGLRVYGRQNLKKVPGGAVSVCNHVHYLDCVMLACNCRRRMMYFASLKSNFEIPLIRHLIKLLGALPLPETSGGMAAFNRAVAKALQKGAFLQIYPEGILYPYYQDGIRPFHKGAFYYACQSGVPVVPYVITFRPRTGWRCFCGMKPLIDLHILEPVWPDASLTRKEAQLVLCAQVKEKMEDCLCEARKKLKDAGLRA